MDKFNKLYESVMNEAEPKSRHGELLKQEGELHSAYHNALTQYLSFVRNVGEDYYKELNRLLHPLNSRDHKKALDVQMKLRDHLKTSDKK